MRSIHPLPAILIFTVAGSLAWGGPRPADVGPDYSDAPAYYGGGGGGLMVMLMGLLLALAGLFFWLGGPSAREGY